eukprot:4057515-Amphidinium_carterae.1
MAGKYFQFPLLEGVNANLGSVLPFSVCEASEQGAQSRASISSLAASRKRARTAGSKRCGSSFNSRSMKTVSKERSRGAGSK